MANEMTLNADILVIDDSMFILKAIEKILSDTYKVHIAKTADEAFVFLKTKIPDLILLDLEMPGKNGLQCLGIFKSIREWRDIPVIFLTAANSREKEEAALNLGAADYILKPITEGVLRKRIQTQLELKVHQKNLESLVDLKTKQLLKTQELILDILANVTTFRDNDTGAHIIRTTNYVRLIVNKLLSAKVAGYILTEEHAHSIINSAKLHDIGKIAISDGILLKTSKLSSFEFEIVKMHTTFGAQMLERPLQQLGDDTSFLLTARDIIMHHHEWWNGTGYPSNLVGSEIPLSARIMAIADVYDALISDRPYKKALSHEEAMRVIKNETGVHLDPFLIDIVMDTMQDYKNIARMYKD